jgi:hypothetical protein
MTQGWVVYGGMRHAEPQREMFPRSYGSQTWYPELLELADDIVYYAPEFDMFLPGDTGSSRAVGPPRWGILVSGTSCRAHLGRTASNRTRPGLGRYHFGCTRSAGDCEASAVIIHA